MGQAKINAVRRQKARAAEPLAPYWTPASKPPPDGSKVIARVFPHNGHFEPYERPDVYVDSEHGFAKSFQDGQLTTHWRYPA